MLSKGGSSGKGESDAEDDDENGEGAVAELHWMQMLLWLEGNRSAHTTGFPF